MSKPIKDHKAFMAMLSAIMFYLAGMAMLSFRYYDIGQTMAVENDFYSAYAPAARNILKIDFSSPAYYEYRGIGYPLALAFLTRITDDCFLSGKIISLFSACLSLILIYLIFSHLSSPLAAFLTTLGLMFTRPFMLYSYTVGTDMFFLALILLSLYLLLAARPTGYFFLLSGFISGYACLTRYNQLFFMVPLLFYLWCYQPTQNFNLRLKNMLSFFGAYLIILLPWFLLLYKMTGNPFYNLNYRNLAYDFIYLGDVDKDYFWQHLSENYQSFRQVFSVDPTSFLLKFAKNLSRHLPQQLKTAFPPYLIWCTALGAIMLLIRIGKSYLRKRTNNTLEIIEERLREKKLLFFFFLAGSYYLFSGLIHFEERYFLFLLPFYLFLAFLPFQYMQNEMSKAGPSLMKSKVFILTVTIALCGAILAPMAYASYQDNIQWLKSLPRELLVFKDFIDFFPTGRKKIMARTAHLPAITGNAFVQLPITSSEKEFYAYLGKKGIDLVYFSTLEAGKRPALASLLYDHSLREGLVPLMKWQTNRKRAVLYMSAQSQMAEPPLLPSFLFNRQKRPEIGLEIPSGSFILTGLIKFENPGTYGIALAGERFNLTLNGIKILHVEKGSPSNFYRKNISLDRGWHLMELTFELGRDNFFLTGPFWQTPEGKKEPIPQTSLIVLDFKAQAK
ncbi:MAG: glycosyltransferase family 39 protein [Candidatus Tectomicrobia bacterium]|uniref:Glycosyltransferase family 39 protein n=1 Tax=Tectimicrobiota bacterium TaxID=2528274 RepID=A0A933GMP5_UNCTE|nr:glycosyltransferase family 39 protein [Candidatus Tectomicrobia bacterium]